jgi:hypothetical protein
MTNIIGKKFDWAIVDEFHNLADTLGFARTSLLALQQALETKPLFLSAQPQFKNPRYPGADVVVLEIERSKHDPLNPNPSAGRSRQYVVEAGGRRSKPFGNSVVAESHAKNLHERLVAALVADEEAERLSIPTWGKF